MFKTNRLRDTIMKTYDHTILSNVDIGSNLGCIDDGIFSNKYVVTDVQWEKCNTESKRSKFQVVTHQNQAYQRMELTHLPPL